MKNSSPTNPLLAGLVTIATFVFWAIARFMMAISVLLVIVIGVGMIAGMGAAIGIVIVAAFRVVHIEVPETPAMLVMAALFLVIAALGTGDLLLARVRRRRTP